jgi:hypothetical protein
VHQLRSQELIFSFYIPILDKANVRYQTKAAISKRLDYVGEINLEQSDALFR